MAKRKVKRAARPDAPPAGGVGGDAPGAPANSSDGLEPAAPAAPPLAGPAPDAPVSAALESFLPALELPAPATDGAAAAAVLEAPAPAPDPSPAAAAPAVSGPVAGPPVEGLEHWSRNKIRRSKRPELARRVEELQRQLETRPRRTVPGAPGDALAAEPSPAAAVEELRQTLGVTLPGLSAALEHFAGAAMRLEAAEQSVLAETWAPALAPKYGELRARVPLVPALLITAGILAPKVLEAMRQAAGRKRAAPAGAVHPGQVAPAPAGEAPRADRPALELVTDATAAGPFGGPRE